MQPCSFIFHYFHVQISNPLLTSQWMTNEADLPKMLARSSGSVSLSSLVRTWRKKHTVGLSNSPNSIAYREKHRYEGYYYFFQRFNSSHNIKYINLTQWKPYFKRDMSLTLSIESERHFLWRKWVTSRTRLLEVLLGRLDSSLNLSHRLNWKVILENTRQKIVHLHRMIHKWFPKTKSRNHKQQKPASLHR